MIVFSLISLFNSFLLLLWLVLIWLYLHLYLNFFLNFWNLNFLWNHYWSWLLYFDLSLHLRIISSFFLFIGLSFWLDFYNRLLNLDLLNFDLLNLSCFLAFFIVVVVDFWSNVVSFFILVVFAFILDNWFSFFLFVWTEVRILFDILI